MTAPARKSGSKNLRVELLSAAECAARTGLTVRALRVYEREGLIEPPRSPKGWRRYGETELTRLNTIVILKALGLTLAQIRTVFADHLPSLARMLAVHAESWKQKRAAADRALAMLEEARERLRTQQTLSVDELCELIKRLESHRSPAMSNFATVWRGLINENTTPEEERVWLTWWAQHPEAAADSGAYAREQDKLHEAAWLLLERGEDPGCPAAQELLVKQNELLARYRIRERTREQLAWNRTATEKWLSLGLKTRRLADGGRGALIADYWTEMAIRSAPANELREVMLEVREIMQTQTDPAAPEFDDPVRRVHQICAQHALGDTLLYIEWGRAIRTALGPYLPLRLEKLDTEHELLERAVRIRAERTVRALPTP